MTNYSLEKIFNEDLVVLFSAYGSQIWGKVTLRKNTTCVELGIELLKGEKAFRPTTNGYNRSHRISEIGMIGILKR